MLLVIPNPTNCFRVFFHILNSGQVLGFENGMLWFQATWPNFFFG